jgi:hypothetical protein
MHPAEPPLMEAAVEVEALRMETYQGMSLNRFGKEAAAGPRLERFFVFGMDRLFVFLDWILPR